MRAVIRDRRQITLPAAILRELNLSVGDAVELEVEDGYLRVSPSREQAVDALAALRRAFQESGVTEKEFQAELRRVRKELNREQYPSLYND